MRYALAFLYHRVATVADDPFRLAISPEAFAAQLHALRRRCTPSALEDLGRPSSRPRFVVTFDDGYADNLHIAAPIAERLGIPMVVYVTSGILGDRRGFWWDRLAAVCTRHAQAHGPSARADVELELGARRLAVRLDGPGAPARLRDTLHARLRLERRAVIEAALDQLALQLGVANGGDADARALSLEEVSELARLGHVQLGAHTVDHELLTLLSGADQERQIADSCASLEQVADVPVRHFAYPFGGRDAFDGNSLAAVRRLGLATAATTTPGRIHRLTPRHRLPRHTVVPDTDPSALLALVGT